MPHRVLECAALLLCFAAASCGGDEPAPIADPAAQEPVAQEPAAEPKAEGGRLRDAVKTEPAAEAPAPSGWSLAATYEERIANVKATLASGPGPYALDIHDLGGWEFDERKQQPFPEHILALDGKEVILRGFMLPDVDFENLKKFHLVRSLWGCCFGAPPGPNEIVRVTLTGDGLDYTYKTLEVRGIFRAVFEMTDGLLDDAYRLEASAVRELGFDDPLAPSNVTPEQRAKFEEFVPGQVEF